MKRLMIAAAALAAATTAQAQYYPPPYARQMLFQITAGDGYMNVRTGPGTNHGLLGTVPAGEMVSASRCVPRDDGIRGANWCFIAWNGMRGWVSQAGLMPMN